MDGEDRDRYRDQIVTCDLGVFLHANTHSLFMNYRNGTNAQWYVYQYPLLVSCAFLHFPVKFCLEM